jgi:hypothetical protein
MSTLDTNTDESQRQTHRTCKVIPALILGFTTPVFAQTPLVGAIQTSDGVHYLYAVDGGGLGGPPYWGLGAAALNTNRTQASSWETFTLVQLNSEQFELQTSGGDWVTAVNGGGVGGLNDNTSPIHSDATQISTDTTFIITPIDALGHVTLQTCDGYYVTANNSGGIGGPNNVPVHTDAPITRAPGAWETFNFVKASCPVSQPPSTYSSINITIATADQSGGARQDSEVVAELNLTGQSQPIFFCLKPSNVAGDNREVNGSSVCPVNPNAPSWGTWSVPVNNQNFPLNPNVTLAPGQANFGSMSLTLVEHPRGLESWDNSYLQGIRVTATDSTGTTTLVSEGSFKASAPPNNGVYTLSGCLLQLSNSNNTVTVPLVTGSGAAQTSPNNGC